MADLLPCPSCKAMLRVPAGAERVRCPQCKTQVAVPGAPVPVAKAVPRPAVPLPFDRPLTAVPIPVAKALPIEKPVVRGRVVREDEETDLKPKPRRRGREDEDNPRFQEMARLCYFARLGVRLLSVAAALSAGTALFYAAFLGSLAIASAPIPILLWLAITCLGLRVLFLIAGFICCLFGPPGMRSTSASGIVLTLLHAGLFIPLALFAVAMLWVVYRDPAAVTDSGVTRVVFAVSSAMNNLNSLTDYPWMFYRGDFIHGERMYIIMMICGALLEFAMMATLGTLVQFYASEGKGHELGFRSLKFVYRIIWVIGILGLFKLGVLLGFGFFGGEGFANQFFRIPHTLLTVAYFLWWAFAWYEQYTSMVESMEVITPSRYLDRRYSLDAI